MTVTPTTFMNGRDHGQDRQSWRLTQWLFSFLWRIRLERLREKVVFSYRVRRSRKALDTLDDHGLRDIGLRRTHRGYEAGPGVCDRDLRLAKALGKSCGIWL